MPWTRAATVTGVREKREGDIQNTWCKREKNNGKAKKGVTQKIILSLFKRVARASTAPSTGEAKEIKLGTMKQSPLGDSLKKWETAKLENTSSEGSKL